MRHAFLLIFILAASVASAQHCPWDCSGLIMIRTNASREEMKKLDLRLTENSGEPVIDTLYGTDAATYDTCRFLYYDDFIQLRSQRIKLHRWYAFDTVYHFAKDHYIVRFNYCKYNAGLTGKLYIRYASASAASGYMHIEVPQAKRIHLHNYSREIQDRQTGAVLEAIEPLILTINRDGFGLE